mmetsp:Transcript_9007/g.25235  ORF Transcript_9007/g.25235 Transcript_9007/m.25235 type:complete len:268 (+) Transcript_9007:255-1058(+)
MSGVSGSPALTASRRRTSECPPDCKGPRNARHTEGGAQSVVARTWLRKRRQSSAQKACVGGGLYKQTVAEAFSGAKIELHACFAQPELDKLTWRSGGVMPIQNMVERLPTGYDRLVWTTSLGRLVVPEVKYRSSGSASAGRIDGSELQLLYVRHSVRLRHSDGVSASVVRRGIRRCREICNARETFVVFSGVQMMASQSVRTMRSARVSVSKMGAHGTRTRPCFMAATVRSSMSSVFDICTRMREDRTRPRSLRKLASWLEWALRSE